MIVWILFVVISNVGGDPLSVVQGSVLFDSKEDCTLKAVEMRLFPENYGCRPIQIAE